jgi:integrase
MRSRTFASLYKMNGGDLYELAKILGHSNIKMTERYAKTSSTAKLIWSLMKKKRKRVVFLSITHKLNSDHDS